MTRIASFHRIGRVILAVVALQSAAVGCSLDGSVVDQSSPPVAEPSSSHASAPQEAVVRKLRKGDRVRLACGLSIRVPARYHGYYVSGNEDTTGNYDSVASHLPPTRGIIQSTSVASLTPNRSSEALGELQQPLIAKSRDDTIEIRASGEASRIVTIAVVVRRPGLPIGMVTMAVFGRHAALSTRSILSTVTRTWRVFRVRGAALPH